MATANATCPTQRGESFRSEWLMAGIIVLWAMLMYPLIVRTGSVIVDGFQSLGAVAGASSPGALRWPMLGGFLGYDQTWGFHWIGWPLLRSLLLPVLPWSPTIDLGICCIIWGGMAWVLFRMVRRYEGQLAALSVAITALIAPGFLVAAQSYRPEILTAFALVMALSFWKQSSPFKRCLCFLLCLVLPTLHPLGLVVPAAWCGFDFLVGWKREGFIRAFRFATIRAFPLLLGCGLLVSWFVIRPLAWTQFKMNLESQRMMIDGLGTGYATFFRWGLGSLGSLPLIVLLATSAVFGLWRIALSFRSSEADKTDAVVLAAVGVLVALGFNILAKNPNSLHLVAILPLAAWLFASAIRTVSPRLSGISFLVPLGFAWCVFLALPIKQVVSLLKHRGVGYRDELTAGLKSLPKARRVLIPVAMWEAAASVPDSATSYRFSTFPNLMSNAQRADYERMLMAEMLPGDLLVWDALQDYGGIFNFVTSTALRHQVIRPMDDGAAWERLPDLLLQTVYTKSQTAVFEVYRKR
jgi:hypothetical protein